MPKNNKKPPNDSKTQRIVTRSGHVIVATPYTPPEKPEPKPLSPEMAIRMIAALDKLYNEQPADAMPDEDYDRIKKSILARVWEYGK